MDLSTNYLGFKLATPIIPGASPMCDDLTTVLRLEDAGAPMIVMHSVFQEQLELEELAVNSGYEQGSDSFPEASGHLPVPEDFKLGPDAYLTQIARIKHAVSIPVIGSINGTRNGWWIDYAKQIEEAGADGLELNIYNPILDVNVASADVERDTLAHAHALRRCQELCWRGGLASIGELVLTHLTFRLKAELLSRLLMKAPGEILFGEAVIFERIEKP